MKGKLFLGMAAAICLTYTSCLAPMQTTGAQSQPQQGQPTQQNPQSGNTQGQDPLAGILGGVVNAGASSAGNLGGIIGNIIASVTGSLTTTQANLIGTWTYTEPCVQFESDNLLKKAGGAAAAAKVENQLVSIYNMVGITPGKLVFTFTNDGNVSYQIGSRTFNGTYTFDSKNKMVNIKTASGMNVNAYVTISGRSMSLCFDSSKVLSLFSAAGSLANISSTLGTIAGLAQNFNGMKTGFKFQK